MVSHTVNRSNLFSSLSPQIRFPLRVLFDKCYSNSSSRAPTCSLSTHTQRQPLPSHFLPLLTSTLPSSELIISTNPYELQRHGRGESYHPTVPPFAILTPKSTWVTSQLAELCYEHNVPMIPFGTGTSLEGHVSALYGGVSVDTSGLDDVDLEGVEDFRATVGAGVNRCRLNEELRHTGMQFMVDPGADASIGGMVACAASGTSAVKYGTMRENILALEAVLPDGTIVRCGTQANKSSAGYDLKALLCGSEGTLGIITRVTVKLHPIPSDVTAAVCSFSSLHEAAQAVAMMLQYDISLDRCELLDAMSIRAFNQYAKDVDDMPISPHLFLEFSGTDALSVEQHVQSAKEICMGELNGSDFRLTSKEDERKHLWKARHQLYYATLSLRPGASNALVTDACVPLSKFADLIQATAEDVQELDVFGVCFGHAGDGNFHCILPLLQTDTEEYMGRVKEVNERLIRRTIEVGGTCTGEHGVGYGKMKYLPMQYGEGAMSMMRSIKRAIDPRNIMNPGKIVTWDEI